MKKMLIVTNQSGKSKSESQWDIALHLSRCLLFSCPVGSDSLQPLGLQHIRLPCPSPSFFFFLIKKWNKKTTLTPHQNSELEVTFGDALSPLVHFQEGKLTRGVNYLLKVTHQCSEQNSGPLIPTSEPVSERAPQVSGYGGGGCGHETGICRLWVPGTLGSAGTLGKVQGGSLCGPGLTSSAAANSVARGCVQGSFGPQLCIQGFSRACIRLKYWFSISCLRSPQLYWEGTDK